MVLFDVDVKGALNLKKIYGASCLSIFVQPPSFEILRNRLIDRNTEDAVSLQKRLDRAEFELSLADQFDTIIVNDQLEEAIRDAKRKILTFAGIDENNE
jgi:guanylate kinase